MRDWEVVKERLDHLYATYDRAFLSTDPLQFPHRYPDPADREVVAFLSSALAYGRVPTILAHLEDLLRRMGPRPGELVRTFDPRRDGRRFAGFVHRFTRGEDVTCLLYWLRQALEREGSLQGFFLRGFDPEAPTVVDALASMTRRMRALRPGPCYGGGSLPASAGVLYLVPDAASESACKRLHLFLRWMVRGGDGLDLGLWPAVRPAQLLIPLDAHVLRLSQLLGFTRRATPGRAMALEVTRALRRLDPADPVKYDFALSRMGILDRCPRRRDANICAGCPLRDICHFWRSYRRRHPARAAPPPPAPPASRPPEGALVGPRDPVLT